MSAEVDFRGRIEAADESVAAAIVKNVRSIQPCELSGRMISLAVSGWLSYRDFEELVLALRPLGESSRIGLVSGWIGSSDDDSSWSSIEAPGDGRVSAGAQAIANFAYALEWESLEARPADPAVVRELVAIDPTLPDADAKAQLVRWMVPHLGLADVVLSDVLRLPISAVEDEVWQAKAVVLAHLDGDLAREAEYFGLPHDELQRLAHARAASRAT